ncbi:MAG TPA: DNA-binding protein, partial [Chloroflexota bacterium]
MPPTMTWPTPNDYCAAVQNPQHCFSADELRGGSIVRDMLGLPKVSSGNFAVVFELEQGRQRYAVKCFTRQIRDQQQRYAAITRYLAGRRLPVLVSFRYFPEGIRLAGDLFPLLTMEWIAGELLHQCVERRLGTPALLRELAEQW